MALLFEHRAETLQALGGRALGDRVKWEPDDAWSTVWVIVERAPASGYEWTGKQ